MGIHYEYARRFVNRPVMVHCRDGRRYTGILHQVTPNMVYLRPLRGGAYPVSADSTGLEVMTADHSDEAIIENVGYGFGGYGGYGFGYGEGIVALSLFAILALALVWW